MWQDAQEALRYTEDIAPARVSAAGIEAVLGGNDDFVSSVLHKDLLIDQNILGTLLSTPCFVGCKSEKKAIKLIAEGHVPHASFQQTQALKTAVEGILAANFVLLFDKAGCAFVFDAKGFEARSIESPESESVVGGSKDGFTEPLRMNTAIIRRHIRSHQLVIHRLEVGSVAKNSVALVYLKNAASPALVEAVTERLEQAQFEGIVSPGQIETALSGNASRLIPTVLSTERADKLCANLYNGRIAVLTDGYPVAFITPACLAMFMQTPEDYASSVVYASFVRLIRYCCLLINLFLPALYIAVANFSCEILPAKLAQSIMQAKYGMPFSTLTEVFLMLIAFEVLIEAFSGFSLMVSITVAVDTPTLVVAVTFRVYCPAFEGFPVIVPVDSSSVSFLGSPSTAHVAEKPDELSSSVSFML